MPDQTVTESLRRTETEPAFDALAGTFSDAALLPIEDVVGLAASPHPQDAKARALLERLGSLAIHSLLKPRLATPGQQVQAAQTLVAADLLARQRMAAQVRRMLNDARLVPLPPDRGLKEEVTPPPRRICDEAWLALRQLLLVEETEDEYWLNAEGFLNLPVEERDTEIAALRQAEGWPKSSETE